MNRCKTMFGLLLLATFLLSLSGCILIPKETY